MTREDIIRFHGVIRKCIVQDFTDTEKEQIELRKREMQRVANNNGGKTRFSDIDFLLSCYLAMRIYPLSLL